MRIDSTAGMRVGAANARRVGTANARRVGTAHARRVGAAIAMRVGTAIMLRVGAAGPLVLALTIACGTEAGAPAEEGWPASIAPSREPAAAEIRGVLNSYYQALSDRDWSAFADHFWPEATLTTVWTPAAGEPPELMVTTVPEFVAQAPAGPGSRSIFEERMLSADITVQVGLAQAWVRYAARFGDPGDVAEWEGVDAFTLLRHDGQWRISSLAYAADG